MTGIAAMALTFDHLHSKPFARDAQRCAIDHVLDQVEQALAGQKLVREQIQDGSLRVGAMARDALAPPVR